MVMALSNISLCVGHWMIYSNHELFQQKTRLAGVRNLIFTLVRTPFLFASSLLSVSFPPFCTVGMCVGCSVLFFGLLSITSYSEKLDPIALFGTS
jgi:hypothetical protein